MKYAAIPDHSYIKTGVWSEVNEMVCSMKMFHISHSLQRKYSITLTVSKYLVLVHMHYITFFKGLNEHNTNNVGSTETNFIYMHACPVNKVSSNF